MIREELEAVNKYVSQPVRHTTSSKLSIQLNCRSPRNIEKGPREGGGGAEKAICACSPYYRFCDLRVRTPS